MSPGALRSHSYEAGGRAEPMIASGPHDRPQVLLIPPLFGEMNRTRRLLADVMRGLAARDIGAWLPDLPGTGESLTPLESVGWPLWQEAAAGAAAVAAGAGPLVVASVRGGALLDDVPQAAGHWRLSQSAGQPLLRDLIRARQLADREDGTAFSPAELETATVELAGYRLSRALSQGLANAVVAARPRLRTLRLAGQGGDADALLDGPPLWRRAEPGASRALAAAIVDDLAPWVATCAAA